MTVDPREAVESLQLRLAQVRATGDPRPLLEPAALGAAWQLRTLAADSADVAELVGWCHWTWYRCQPTGADDLHFHAALSAFAPLHPTRLGSVPSGLRLLVGDLDAVADSHSELGLALLSNPVGMSHAAAAAIAVSAFRMAIAMLPDEHPAQPKYLTSLSVALQTWHSAGGSEALLDEAAAASREALRLTPPDESRRLGRIANLVGVLTERFRAGRGPTDLDEAISVGRAAVAEPMTDRGQLARLAGNLAGALFARAEAVTADLPELAEADLTEAAGLYRMALADTPSSAPHRLSWQEGLWECDIRRYAHSGQPADRDAAIGSVRDYVSAAPDGRDRIARLGALLHLLRTRVDDSPAPGDLEEAISVGRRLVADDRLAGRDRFRALVDLGAVLRRRFDGTGAAEDLDDAIAAGRAALAAADEMTEGAVRSELPSLLMNLARRLNLRFARSEQPADLTDAITFARRAVAATLPGDPSRPSRASDLVGMLAARHKLAGNQRDLDDALDLAREVAADTPSDHPYRPATLYNLASILQRREPPGPDDLAEAIAAVDEAIELSAGTPRRSAPSDRTLHIGDLVIVSAVDEAMLALAAAKIRFKRFLLTRAPTELDDALAAVLHALSVTSAAHPDRPDLLFYRSTLLVARQARTWDPGDLAAALTATNEALADGTAETVHRPLVQNNLGVLLLARFQLAGDPDDLAQALAVTQDALAHIPSDDPSRFRTQGNIGGMLIERFRLTGKVADLDEAITILRDLRDQRDVAPEVQPNVLVGLANALDAHFDTAGDTAELDEAIVAATTAVTLARNDSPTLINALNSVSLTLTTRFDHAGDQADLDGAITAGRQAAAAAPPQTPIWRNIVSGLSIALRRRFERTGHPADIETAVRLSREAAAGEPPNRELFITNLANILRTRFEQLKQPTDLDESIRLYREVLPGRAYVDPSGAIRRFNLGAALLDRYEYAGDPADLAEAVAVLNEAARAAGPANFIRPLVLFNLGDATRRKYQRSGRQDDADAAARYFAECARLPTALPVFRIRSARAWAEVAEERADWPTAQEAMDVALDLLPQLTDRRIGRESRQYHIKGYVSGLAVEAAVAALELGGSDAAPTALIALERARGILITQALQANTDISALREHHPELARQFERARELLNAEAPQEAESATTDRVYAPVWTALHRREAASGWDQILATIRSRPGFEQFLGEPRIDELVRTAVGGTIVAVNPARRRSHALILTEAGVHELQLDALTLDDAVTNANMLLTATHRHAAAASDATARAVLAWLWETVAGPVLDHLGHTEAMVEGQQGPRVWWMPTGPLAVLPLHAAGYHSDRGQGRRTVLDRVVSSYTPTVRALQHARRPSPVHTITDMDRHLVVAAAGHSDQELPQARAEAELVAEVLPGDPRPLVDDEATFERVMGRLANAHVAHFACHALTMADPSSSYLALHDIPLRVSDLDGMHFDDAYLAYLSACSTASGTQLPDESIHVASAFQLAGFRHVVGTIWPTVDQIARDFAALTYQGLLRGAQPANALHDAVLQMRNRHRTVPYLWSAHIHIGP